MLTKLTSSQKITALLFLCLLLTGTFFWASRQTQAAPASASIMYFAAHPTAGHGHVITPQSVRQLNLETASYKYVREVGFTSDWQVLRDLAAKNELDALIIHASAEEQVDWQELQTWFIERGLVVAGIEIDGYRLAERLGMPSMALEPVAGKTFDYHIYSVKLVGQPEDIEKLAAAGHPDNGIEGIQHPLTFGRKSSCGSFDAEDSLARFLGQLDAHFISRSLQ